ncbi:MAG: hypothetical protein ACD_51C00312G0001 [uncultured bacterium]|nr:MAG: hypothetical protein ACD_51C00312G0001 [uncultured bacterium]OGJ47034.1 MAG: hypothetical protein A2244_04830 [Candidatus Peregrinibacteria bacterium RIFOXYA2_FULL_41_18]OGJ49722.1 MAG: hypothetical protein A2344_03490 [Candidatus Peregrinibacteria bacterium RIFOXYB12_FULL_41_12]OGJ53525.1 MAG: hypothetical protein A2448_01635 [Candidatus Peregrinibacteria bacterium RIFOXYC2_FULL_41_22]
MGLDEFEDALAVDPIQEEPKLLTEQQMSIILTDLFIGFLGKDRPTPSHEDITRCLTGIHLEGELLVRTADQLGVIFQARDGIVSSGQVAQKEAEIMKAIRAILSGSYTVSEPTQVLSMMGLWAPVSESMHMQ